jgi:hypothetical protein
MLGAASEGAWYLIARAVDEAGWGDDQLSEGGRVAQSRAHKIQDRVWSSLKRKFAQNAEFEAAFGFRRSELSTLEANARCWREQRNWGLHPVGPIDVSAFKEATVGLQLAGATTYFARLTALLRGART